MAASIAGSSTRDILQAKGERFHTMLVEKGSVPHNSSWQFIYPARQADVCGGLLSSDVCPTHIHHLSPNGQLLRVSCVHDILIRCPTCSINTEAEKEAFLLKPEAGPVIVTAAKARIAFIDCIAWFMHPSVVLEIPPPSQVEEVLNQINYRHYILGYKKLMTEIGYME